MKIEAVGHTIVICDPHTKMPVEYEPGKPFEMEDKEARHLIELGFACKVNPEPEKTNKENSPPAAKSEDKTGGDK